MSQMPSPAFVELPIITTSLLQDIERLRGSMAHRAAGEESGCLMPISNDSGSSKGKGVRETSGHFVCGWLSYWGELSDGWILRRFLIQIHTQTHTHVIKYQIGRQSVQQLIFPLSCLSLACSNIKGRACGHYHSHYSY